jgi:hypothetical protein
MAEIDSLASNWAELAQWLYPILWLLVGALSWAKGRRLAGALFALACGSSMLFTALFADGSTFTEGWETDSPLNVAFGYQPLGFALANGLPILANLLPVLGAVLVLSRREA